MVEQLTMSLDPIPPKPQPAEDGLPLAIDLKALIREEHRRAELQRLDSGQGGCGCADCQALYRTIDLENYGNRVEIDGAFIGIEAGKAGTDHTDSRDYWADNDAVFVHNGKRYGISRSGATILFKDTKPLEGDVSSESIGLNDVTKLAGGNILPPQPKTALKWGVLLHPGGRPKKSDDEPVSRMTKWRQNKRGQAK